MKDSVFQIKSLAYDTVLDASSDSTGAGTLRLEKNNDVENQNRLWQFISLNDGSYKIKSLGKSTVIDAWCGATGVGSAALLPDKDEDRHQKWQLIKLDNGAFKIRSTAHETILDSTTGSTGPESVSFSEEGSTVDTCQMWHIIRIQ